MTGKKRPTRKVKSLKPKSVSGKHGQEIKGGAPPGPTNRGKYLPPGPNV
jgi:hypothetical protein